MALGFVHPLKTALLLGALLRVTLPALEIYGKRVGVVIVAGMAAACWTELSSPG
jgi:hypothetical protein